MSLWGTRKSLLDGEKRALRIFCVLACMPIDDAHISKDLSAMYMSACSEGIACNPSDHM